MVITPTHPSPSEGEGQGGGVFFSGFSVPARLWRVQWLKTTVVRCTMKITLEMLGAMKKPLGQGPVDVEVGEGTTVERFMVERLGYDPAHVGLLSYFIEGEAVKPSTVLKDGNRLKILMVIGGG
jgi:sulfur carrier protein ThiS